MLRLRMILLLAFGVAVVSCARTQDAPLRGNSPLFDPVAFFSDETQGRGLLRIGFGTRVDVHVAGSGQVDGNTLSLVQVITEGDKPPRRRIWRMRQTAPGRFEGTLTDAAGPVIMIVEQARGVVAYRSRAGYKVRQTLDLVAPDRLENHLVASLAGLPIAELRETIIKR